MKQRRAKTAFIFIMIIMIIITGCSAAANDNPTENEQEKETPVQVEPVKKGSLMRKNEIIGSVTPMASVDIFPKMNGELLRLHVEKGDEVKKGTVLAELSATDLYDQLELESLSLELAQEQYKNLYTSGAPDSQLKQAEISIEQANIRIKQIQKNIEDATIRAPIDGEIVYISREIGEYVTVQAPLFSIVTMNPVILTANLNVSQMMAFQDKEVATIYIPDLNETVTAEIIYLSSVTNETGFYTIEAKVANDDKRMKPGMLAKFIIEEQLVEDEILVPTASIIEKSGHSYVYIVVNDRAEERIVEVIESQSDITAIQGDIEENDLIVVKGQTTLSDGNKVLIIEGAK